MWMKSKTGMWHKVGELNHRFGFLPVCQSYNLDRPNRLHGEATNFMHIPEDDKICKKCLANVKDGRGL